MTTDSPNDKESRFMAECLKNFDVNRSKIDMVAVASAMGYSNPHSAGNKFKVLKNKFGLKQDCFYSGSVVGTSASLAPKAKRVRKKAAPKAKKGSVEDIEVKAENVEDAEVKAESMDDTEANAENMDDAEVKDEDHFEAEEAA